MQRTTQRSNASGPRAARIARLLFGGSSIIFLVFACVAELRGVQNDTPRQGWWQARGPVVPHDTFPADCSICHAEGDWHSVRDDFTFDHLAQTGVDLVGAHAQAECLRCHNDKGPVAVFDARGCSGCHEDVLFQYC